MFPICTRLFKFKYIIHPDHYSRIFCSSAISKISLIPRTTNSNFSFPISRQYITTVKQNPQKDEEGNDMNIEITDRAVNVIIYIKKKKIFFFLIFFFNN